MKALRQARWLAVLVLMVGLTTLARAEPGVSAQKVVFGMSGPLSGPLAQYGNELARGLQLGFGAVNAAGGVAGRQIDLLVRDDGGRPANALANTRALLEAGVLGLTGYFGSASIEAVLPLVGQSGVPMIGVASSAEVLREPFNPLVFNLRAGVLEETAAMVLHLDTVGITGIAAISQDDALGRAGREGIRVELARLAMRPIIQAQVPAVADEAALRRAVETVCKGQPQVLVLALGAQNALAVIRQARLRGCTKQVYVMSEAGAQMAIDNAAARDLAGVVVSQVVPHPESRSVPAVAEYARHAAQAGQKPSYPGLEGFLYARFITEALQRCGRDASRRCLMTALESKPLDIGGYRVQFSPNDHRGSRFVEMTIMSSDGRFRR